MPQKALAVTAAKNPTGTQKPLNVDADGNSNRVSATGGDAVTIADGADVALGAKADAAYTTGSGSVIALLKNAVASLTSLITGASFLNNAAGSAGVAVKASAGTLYGVSINTGGTTTTVALYNSATTAANLIGTFDTTAQGALTFGRGIAFSNGLWMVASTVTPADITIMYK